MKSQEGKVVLITGASSGIGRAVAEAYHQLGASVVLVARRKERLETLAADLSAQGAPVLALTGDVTSEESMRSVAEAALKRFGRLDVLFANAGFGVVGNVDKLSTADFQLQFDTNVFGVLRSIYAFLPALKESRGSIAVTGSVMGFISLPGGAPYSMSKFAVRALCDSLYAELRPLGVSVTHIAPGFVASEIRSVNNQGAQVENFKEPVPAWLLMPTDKAARQIVSAIIHRKREQVVTAHGKATVFLQKHFSALIAFLVSRFGVKHRTQAN